MSYFRIIFYCAALAALCVSTNRTGATTAQIAELERQLQAAVQQGSFEQLAEIKRQLEPLYSTDEAAVHDERGHRSLDQGGDNCASAVTIPSLPFCDVGTTSGYLSDYTASCASSAAPDVVYRYVTTADEQVIFSLCGSSYDAVLHVWRGCPSAGGVEIGCNDDFCGLQPCLTLNLDGVDEYFIIVDGYSANAGAYRFNAVPAALGCVSASCGWANDDCEEATLLTTPASIMGSTIGATIDFPAGLSNCSVPNGPGVWYKFSGQDSVASFRLTNTTVPHQLYLFCGCCYELWCLFDTGCDPLPFGIGLEAGVTYWLLVAGCDGAQGEFSLQVSYDSPHPNGGCGDPMEHDFTAPGEVSGTTCGQCNWCGLRPSEDALARVYIPFDGNWIFSLCGSDFDTYLYIGNQPCSGNIFARDDTCGLQTTTPCLWLTEGTYFVSIEAWASLECGNYTLRVNPCPMPAPLRLVISPHFPDIQLNWDAAPSAPRNYKVYRSLNPENVVQPANLIGVSATPSYVDAGILLNASDRYHYAVTAFAP